MTQNSLAPPPTHTLLSSHTHALPYDRLRKKHRLQQGRTWDCGTAIRRSTTTDGVRTATWYGLPQCSHALLHKFCVAQAVLYRQRLAVLGAQESGRLGVGVQGACRVLRNQDVLGRVYKVKGGTHRSGEDPGRWDGVAPALGSPVYSTSPAAWEHHMSTGRERGERSTYEITASGQACPLILHAKAIITCPFTSSMRL